MTPTTPSAAVTARPFDPDDPELRRLAPGIRLVVTDMDGTLLRPDKSMPAGFDEILAAMAARDIILAPASGRQYATLADQFAEVPCRTLFIAENGTNVVQDGREFYTSVLDPVLVRDVVEITRSLSDDGLDVGAIVCRPDGAVVDRSDAAFMEHVDMYYVRNDVVDDLLGATGGAIKVAIFSADHAEDRLWPAYERLSDRAKVTVSGRDWLAIVNLGTDKGTAVATVQERLGIGVDQTVVFGDYLNDLELMGRAALSFAMANAHPRILAAARAIAPSNADDGVVQVLRSLVTTPKPAALS
ncbi:HAD-IIB family hydrolase [Acidipropionibacterium timonense]|uniref:HAD-IIB family hydrolase n=1 Tax=Acidipropionibacterium timonense TaxID=2161818 RepID=UPI001AEC0E60|nr:HAD family hydrolase [Acidipropionibacterium timonense]